MVNPFRLSNKLCTAINRRFHTHIVVNSVKFYGDDDRPMTVFSVRDSYKGRDGKHSDELYRTSSAIFVCFFLKDLMDYLSKGEVYGHNNEAYEWQFENRGIDKTLKIMEKKYGIDELRG